MIKHIKVWFVLPLVTIIVGVAIVIIIKPTWGIDFTGGSLMELDTNNANVETTRALLNETNISLSVQASKDNRMIIKAEPLTEEQHSAIISVLNRENILKEELRFESIGPTIGAELRRKSVIALSLAVIMLIVYLAYTFRQVSGFVAPWKLGLAAVYASVHDLLFVLALFVVLGRLYGVPIDTMFITAILAILGYSVNDTIVIFNRFKTEWLASRGDDLLTVLDRANTKSLTRSLNTGWATLLVLFVLLAIGGATIKWFIVALIAGTVVGTYSSIFVAPPILFYLAKFGK
jgi:preprotein translocase subunit SecF